MKISIIYSSVTGNTEKLARGIRAIFSHNTHICSIEQAPSSPLADLYLLGFWVRRGAPDNRMAQFMRTLQGQQVAFFGTLGAYPDSPHARKVIEAANELLTGNTVLGSFLCQGKIHASLTKTLQTDGALRMSHPMTPERIARHEEAAKHPDEEDIRQAQEYFQRLAEGAKKTTIAQKERVETEGDNKN